MSKKGIKGDEDFTADFEKAGNGGFFDLKDWSVIEVSGPDARDFLNRMSTLDFKNWDPTQTRYGAFLTGKSGVIALGFFQSAGEGFYILVPPSQGTTVLGHIEQFHFAEKMTAKDVSSEWALFALWKTKAPGGVSAWPDPFRPELLWVKVPKSECDAFRKKLQKDSPELGRRVFEYFRRQAGVVDVGEIDSSVMILEAGLERAIDRGKGCYPGQEVVERIFTYGQVNRKLHVVTLSGEWRNLDLPFKFTKEGRPGGLLVSLEQNPTDSSKAIGLALIYKAFWKDSTGFEEAGVKIQP